MSTSTFGFGKNWHSYLKKVDKTRIEDATASLKTMLNQNDFKNLRFLDAGCGSGLFSLAAVYLGAEEVISFDADQDSVTCAHQLNHQFGPFENWKILCGSVLNKKWLDSLGKFDIVYSWGVLHHTGDMHSALENIAAPVRNGGMLFVSIYNDQGAISKLWLSVKKFYNQSVAPLRFLIAAGYFAVIAITRTALGILKLKPFSQWYKGSERGMSLWHDTVDWVGGYPFETADTKSIENHFTKKGFTLIKIRKKSGSGCNEFVFSKNE